MQYSMKPNVKSLAMPKAIIFIPKLGINMKKDYVDPFNSKGIKCVEDIECDHEFAPEEGNEGWHIRGLGETLERDYICNKCGLHAREIYIYSCTMDDDDNII